MLGAALFSCLAWAMSGVPPQAFEPWRDYQALVGSTSAAWAVPIEPDSCSSRRSRLGGRCRL